MGEPARIETRTADINRRSGSTLTRKLFSINRFGVAVELSLFIFFWLLSALYVRRANSEFDALTQEVIKQARKEDK